MKTALVYDRVNKWGGAERVLLALHEIFPEAPLYTSVYNSKTAPWAKVFSKVIPSLLQKIPFASGNHEFLGSFTPIAFESFDFSQYDLVISVTSEAAKGIITKPGTLHICYCLTPTRYLWSGSDFYIDNPPSMLKKIPYFKYISKPIMSYLRNWDRVAAQRPDVVVAISEEVKKRIKKYYQREARVIYPPVEVNKFINLPKSILRKYYLVVNRLIPYKKVDLVIEAFNRLKWPLVIVGTGSEDKRLRKMARKNKSKAWPTPLVIFKGFVSEKDLINYYRGAKALIVPQEEDFGMVSIEAQAVGVPVIAYKKGGSLETVIEGKTGLFFNKQTPECLTNALYKFDKMQFNRRELVNNAERFSQEKFKNEFKRLVEEKR